MRALQKGYVKVGDELEHRAIAERAIGKRLPRGAEVHHVDGNRSNNAPANLVICPDTAYHRLLHMRAAAFAATGNYDHRRCRYCLQWSQPGELKFNAAARAFYHAACHADFHRNLRARKKAQCP